MITQNDIVAILIKRNKKNHLFDFFPEVCVEYLDAEHAALLKGTLLKEDADLSTWDETGVSPLNESAIIETMVDYMAFAWGKVLDHRGISANRSVQKFEAWCTILGRNDLVEYLSGQQYAMYGAPMLAKICEAFNIALPEGRKIRRMIKGLPCTRNCDEGC